MMRYPTGFPRQVLWGAVLFVCFGLALVFNGYGLVMDWLVLTALAYWHLSTKARSRSR